MRIVALAVLALVCCSMIPLSSCTQVRVPYETAPGVPVELKNSKQAYNRPWQEVVKFLENDTTNEESYATPSATILESNNADKEIRVLSRNSGRFAERLHNRAEYQGFRCGFSVVEFVSGERYAMNAFETVDCGVVYVDCSGPDVFIMTLPDDIAQELGGFPSYDKVAFVKQGEELGLVSLEDCSGDFTYDWYQSGLARLRRDEQHYADWQMGRQGYEAYVKYRTSPGLAFTSEMSKPHAEYTSWLRVNYPSTSNSTGQPDYLNDLLEKIRSGEVIIGSTEENQELYREWQQKFPDWDSSLDNPLNSPDSRFKEWTATKEAQFAQEKLWIVAEWEQLSGFAWESGLGCVNNVKTYW